MDDIFEFNIFDNFFTRPVSSEFIIKPFETSIDQNKFLYFSGELICLHYVPTDVTFIGFSAHKLFLSTVVSI